MFIFSLIFFTMSRPQIYVNKFSSRVQGEQPVGTKNLTENKYYFMVLRKYMRLVKCT
jgi:hypothetical protein